MQHKMTKDKLDDAETQSQASITSKSRKFYDKLRLKSNEISYYAENSTVHGIKYLGDKGRPKSEKIYWILIFIVSFIILGFFIKDVTLKWQQQFFVLVEDDCPTPVYKIPFPAVTICPQAKVKSEDFTLEQLGVYAENRDQNFSIFENYFQKMEIAQQICSTVQTIVKNFSEVNQLSDYHVGLLHEISPSLDDIIQHVEMPDSCEMKLSRLININLEFALQNETFSTILTNEGVCFTYNLPSDILRSENLQTGYPYHDITNRIKGWNYETGYSMLNAFPKVACSAGEVSSLRIELTSSHPDIKTICQPTSLGYKIILHSPAVYPTTFENYIGINHESETKIKVKPVKITTAENLRDYSPHDRRCYFNNERYLQFYKFYNRANCKLECFANYTIHFYGCVHFAFPRSDDVPICGMRNNFKHVYEFVDSIDSLINYLNEFRDIDNGLDLDFSQSYEEFEGFSCNCLTECNSLEYVHTIVAESFKGDHIHPEMRNTVNESVYSPTIINIFWEEPQFVGRTRKQWYTMSDMVSNLGGLVGLFMGASVLSIFEILYFCVVRRIDPTDV